MWYTATDIMILLGVSRSKAYKIMKKLSEEIGKTRIPGKDICYEYPPSGKIQKRLFCEKFLLNVKECESILSQGGRA